MMDFSLLKNPQFVIIGFANMIGMLGFYTPFVYLPSAAVEKVWLENWKSKTLLFFGILYFWINEALILLKQRMFTVLCFQLYDVSKIMLNAIWIVVSKHTNVKNTSIPPARKFKLFFQRSVTNIQLILISLITSISTQRTLIYKYISSFVI